MKDKSIGIDLESILHHIGIGWNLELFWNRFGITLAIIMESVYDVGSI